MRKLTGSKARIENEIIGLSHGTLRFIYAMVRLAANP